MFPWCKTMSGIKKLKKSKTSPKKPLCFQILPKPTNFITSTTNGEKKKKEKTKTPQKLSDKKPGILLTNVITTAFYYIPVPSHTPTRQPSSTSLIDTLLELCRFFTSVTSLRWSESVALWPRTEQIQVCLVISLYSSRNAEFSPAAQMVFTLYVPFFISHRRGGRSLDETQTEDLTELLLKMCLSKQHVCVISHYCNICETASLY